MSTRTGFSDPQAQQAVVAQVIETAFSSAQAQSWFAKAGRFIVQVRSATDTQLQDPSFLKNLFNDTTLSDTGMGSVRVDAVLDDTSFRTGFATAAAQARSMTSAQKAAAIRSLYDDTLAAFDAAGGRRPLLKVNRMMAALFPEAFTTIAALAKLRFLHQRLGGSVNDHPVDIHSQVRAKLDAAAQQVHPGLSEAQLLCLPWYVFEHLERTTDEVSAAAGTSAGAGNAQGVRLAPKSASLRRKGLTAVHGYFDTLRRLVDELRDGLTRDELAAVVKDELPNYSDSSIRSVIAQLRGQFALWYADGDRLCLTPLGLSLLDNGDPDELGDHLLTRVFGVDHFVAALATGPVSRDEIFRRLRDANPNWTSNFAPSALFQWLVSLGVVRTGAEGMLSLTERGQEWAAFITWMPETLVASAGPESGAAEGATEQLRLEPFPDVVTAVKRVAAGRSLRFQDAEVASVHSALWFHRSRHFVVMAGLSGTGKTQLARAYADGLCGDARRVLIQPVEPGWFDSSPLLGFVDPVRSVYRATRFLRFLADAVRDPGRPYVVILDEMNLSHPEQYMAPLLSAMETGDVITLHSLDEDVAGDIPQQLAYPSNLAIIGTVNMDETTHGLSDKVLDRAYTLEFWDVRVGDFPGWQTTTLEKDLGERVRALLEGLNQALAPARMHFGWRTIGDVIQFVEFSAGAANLLDDPLDAVVYAKVLPKLRGESAPAFHQALDATLEVLKVFALARSAEKVRQLQADLTATGTARFWR